MDSISDVNLPRPTWVEIDLDAVAHNVSTVRRSIGSGVFFFAVLKAEAYGHGLAPVAETCLEHGADGISVGNPFDAVCLREHGLRCPILLYASTLPSQASTVLKYGLIPTVMDLEAAQTYSRLGDGRPMEVYVKVDTGFNRLGVPFHEAVDFIASIRQIPNLVVQGIYTHLTDASVTSRLSLQADRFAQVTRDLRERGIEIPIRMVAASSVVISQPELHHTAVNPGHLLYGLRGGIPDTFLAFRAFKSRVIHTKAVPAGDPVGYTLSFIAKRPTIIGVLPLGYADGYSHRLGNRGHVLVRGMRASVVGDVSVEYVTIDLTDVPGARVGDEAVLIGKQEGNSVTLAEVAELCGMTPLQLLVSINRHIPQVYLRKGEVVSVHAPSG